MGDVEAAIVDAVARVEAAADVAVEKFLEKIAPVLEDVSFRIEQAYEVASRVDAGRGKVFAEDLNLLGKHFITGYAVTANSPSAGSIAWTDVHIVYDGTDFSIENGNTNLKFVWWSPITTPTKFQMSNTKPTLAAGEVLVFTNNSGQPLNMLSDTNQSLPGQVANGAIDSGAIIANAVGAAQLADGSVGSAAIGANAVVSGKIADGAVNRAGVIAANTVTSTQIADNAVVAAGIAANAVTAAKVADGAVSRAGVLAANVVTSASVANGAVSRAAQLGTDVVTSTQIAANAVGTAQVAAGAVTATELGANAVTAVKVADGAVSRAGQLAANVVTAGKVADGAVNRAGVLAANVVTTGAIAGGAVTGNEIAPGAVNPSKLNTLQHLLY